MNCDKVVISIGGSILIPDLNDSVYIRQLAHMMNGLKDKVQLVVVCGGGKIARYYTSTASELGATVFQQDMLGIGATRLNAELFALALGASTEIPLTAKAAALKSKPGTIVVMGGTEPGHTTDAVAAMVAKEINAKRVINATSVDAVYTDDPRKNPAAKKILNMTIKELEGIVYKEHGAGKSSVFDPMGVQIAMEHKIDIMMVDGRNIIELENAILGKKINGTFVNSH